VKVLNAELDVFERRLSSERAPARIPTPWEHAAGRYNHAPIVVRLAGKNIICVRPNAKGVFRIRVFEPVPGIAKNYLFARLRMASFGTENSEPQFRH
jgi:hypothetical protein